MSSTGVAERSRLVEFLPRIALPLSFFAAAAARAAFLTDAADTADAASNTAELSFLALVGTVVLLGIGTLDRADQFRTGVIALLAALGLWAIPPGDVRGASIFALLVVGLGLVTYERVRVGLGTHAGELIAWALAVQALCRPELYLAPRLDPGFLFEALAFPTLAALALSRLAQQEGKRLWLALLAIAVIDGGFGPEVALALVVLAASRALPRLPETAAWVACALLVIPAFDRQPFSLAIGVTIGITVAVAVVAAFLLANRNRTAIVATIALAGWLFLQFGGESAIGSIRTVVLGLVVLPLAAFAPPAQRLRAATGLALAAVAGLVLPAGAALTAPLVAIAAALPKRGRKLRIQAGWLGLVSICAGLAAIFPWLRPVPLESALGWMGLQLEIETAAIALLAFWLVATLARRSPATRRIPLAAIGLILVAAVLLANPQQRLLVSKAFVLDSEASSRSFPLDLEIHSITIDSYVSNAAQLADGTLIGRIVLEGEGGAERVLPLALGRETGEWAARRPGLEPVSPALAPWISWLAPDGAYFAQRYRANWTVGTAVSGRGFRVELEDSLPKDVSLAVFRIGAR